LLTAAGRLAFSEHVAFLEDIIQTSQKTRETEL